MTFCGPAARCLLIQQCGAALRAAEVSPEGSTTLGTLFDQLRRLFLRLREHIGQRDRLAALAEAFVGGFHEGEDLDRLGFAHGWGAGAEEGADLAAEGLVADGFGSLAHTGAAEDECAELRLALHDAAIGADAAVFPHAGDLIGDGTFGARNGLAAGAHEREERLDAVDGVEEEVRCAVLIRARAPRRHAEDVADLGIVLHRDQIGSEARG